MAFSKLTDLQLELLHSFFAREKGFFLTGGGALVGYHLHHRQTQDLDLFTLDEDAFERGAFALSDAAVHLGARMVVRQEAPGFRRYFVSRGDEAVVVDLVLERVPQIVVEKWEVDGVRIDPPYEILVNKLTTIVSRCEIRDLVDLMLLEQAGHLIEDALDHALTKDGGCTPATLAWTLSQVEISEEAELPGGISPREMRAYVGKLITRLRRAARPNENRP